MARLGPTTLDLLRDDARPYFLFWTDGTVADLRAHLASPDLEERAYWMGALLREANTRDVWLFVTVSETVNFGPVSFATWEARAKCGRTYSECPNPRGRRSKLDMFSKFDARVVSGEVLAVLRACQERVPCTLGGGAALSGAHLGHPSIARRRPGVPPPRRRALARARFS